MAKNPHNFHPPMGNFQPPLLQPPPQAHNNPMNNFHPPPHQQFHNNNPPHNFQPPPQIPSFNQPSHPPMNPPSSAPLFSPPTTVASGLLHHNQGFPSPSLAPVVLQQIMGNVGAVHPNVFDISNCVNHLSPIFSKIRNDFHLKKYRVIPKLAFRLCWQLILDRYSKSHDRHNSMAISEIQEGTRKVFCVDFAPPHEFLSVMSDVKLIAPDKVGAAVGKDNVLVIANMIAPPPKEFLKSITDFLGEGGKLLCLGCNPNILGILFSGMIKSGATSCTTGASLKISKTEGSKFSGYTVNEKLQIESNRTTFVAANEKVEELAAIGSGTSKELMLVRFPFGKGQVYVFSSKLFVQERVETLNNLSEWLQDRHASKTTVAAWKTPAKIGYSSVVLLAASAWPSLELVWNIILE